MVKDHDQIRRVNKVILYIENNLSDDLNIDRLADLACYSKYHFNRIFKSITNESIYHYIKRVRLERASHYLWGSDLTISEVAIKCGFNSTANFSYSFKKHFGITPIEQKKKNIAFQNINKEELPNLEVEVKTIPAMTLAYKRFQGSYGQPVIPHANELYKWCSARNLVKKECSFILRGYDSPYVTKDENCRSDICIVVPEGTIGQGNINIDRFPAIRVVSCKIYDLNKLSETVDDLDTWVLASGYQTIVDVPTMIIYHNVIADSLGVIDISNIYFEICFPIKPR